jgi:hypothetical protein
MRDGHSYKHNKISIEMVSHKDQNPTAETIKIKTIDGGNWWRAAQVASS